MLGLFTALLLVSLFSSLCFAEPSGRILVYASHNEEFAQITVQEFMKLYPKVQVEHIRLSAGPVLARIKAERNRPQASVWWGGPADTYAAAKEEGLLEPYFSAEAEHIPAKFKDAEGYWTGFYVGLLGFTINDRSFKELGVSVPTSWGDLLRPEFKDLIVMANPGTSGTAYTVLATLVQLWGEEEAFAYLKKLDANIQQYPTSGSAAGRMAGLGEVAIGIDYGHAVPQLAVQGYPVSGSFPKEGTGYEIGGAAIIKDAPEPELARLFLDFVLSKQGQELAAKVGAYPTPIHAHAEVPPQAVPIDAAELIDYDFGWAGKNRDRLVERWNDEILMEKGN